MKSQWVAIVNPAAGHGRCGRHASGVLAKLKENGLLITERRTELAGHGTQLVRDAYRDGYRNFVAIGGDGTSFEVVNGLFPEAIGKERTPRLAILPLGTGNSFMRDFGVTDIESAMKLFKDGSPKEVDIVRCVHNKGELFYINILSVGFSARVGDLTNRRFKRFGSKGYIFALVACLLRLKQQRFPYVLEDGPLHDKSLTMLSFCNSRFTGGTMMMAPMADVFDGRLDVVALKPVGRVQILKDLSLIFKGSHIDLEEVECGGGSRVDFKMSEPVPVMVDGEIQLLTLRALEVVPHCLEVLLPIQSSVK